MTRSWWQEPRHHLPRLGSLLLELRDSDSPPASAEGCQPLRDRGQGLRRVRTMSPCQAVAMCSFRFLTMLLHIPFGDNSSVVGTGRVSRGPGGTTGIQSEWRGLTLKVVKVAFRAQRHSPSHAGCSPDHEPLRRQVRSGEPRSWYPTSQEKRRRLLVLNSSPSREPCAGVPGSPQNPGLCPVKPNTRAAHSVVTPWGSAAASDVREHGLRACSLPAPVRAGL